MQKQQLILMFDTIDGIFYYINLPKETYEDYPFIERHLESLSQSANCIYLVYNNTTHLVSSNLKVSLDFAHKLAWDSATEITMKVFDKSDTDEVMILASKIHNVDLIPIQVMKN
jgi:hypothetical protein